MKLLNGLLLFVGDPAVDTALMVTSLVTAFSIALVLAILFLPDEDRRRLGDWYVRSSHYLLTGSTGRVTEFDHDFDGIRELDNRIPPWFTTLFAVTLVFGGIYFLNYHVFQSSKLSGGEYQDELVAADLHRRILLASEGTIDEATLTPLTDASALNRGGANFQKNCVTCHGAQAQGIVGPNLTDDYWIHGGGIKDVYATIKQGVPAKGMISWQLVFTPKQIQEIASYVLSVRGTNPPGAKKAEGALYVAVDTASAKKVDGSPHVMADSSAVKK
jgi:cytochrome c oxidase cbb3-type subunit III